MTERELLVYIYELTRQALFERSFRAAAKKAVDAIAEINKLTVPYK